MKRSRFTEAQIAFIQRQGEEGTAVGEICRKTGISEATYYNWRKKYGGLMPSEMKRLRQLEEENGKLKKIVADLDKEMLQDVIRRILLIGGSMIWVVLMIVYEQMRAIARQLTPEEMKAVAEFYGAPDHHLASSAGGRLYSASKFPAASPCATMLPLRGSSSATVTCHP